MQKIPRKIHNIANEEQNNLLVKSKTRNRNFYQATKTKQCQEIEIPSFDLKYFCLIEAENPLIFLTGRRYQIFP